MTIYDIAKACGVSIATVSRVLNGSNKVRPKTRDLVLAAMQEQNYCPNPFARGLGLDSMKMIGILCEDVSDAFFAKAVSLVEHDLRERGLDVILGCTGQEVAAKKKYLQIMLNKHVDAIILIGSPFRDDVDNNQYIVDIAKKVPIVTINSLMEIDNIYCVVCDESSSFRQSVELLAASGHKSILYIYDRLTYSGQQKIKGYRDGLMHMGIKENPKLIYKVRHTFSDTQALVTKLLEENLPFDAIMASEDLLAVGAEKALVASGRSMPVIGCNNSILAECSTPTLTSIDNRLEMLCPNAVDMVTKILRGEGNALPSKSIFPSYLVFRDSFHPDIFSKK
jgi:LacI family transcriptional regulator